MKIKLTELEEKLGYPIKKNYKSIGLDIAERTGVCIITTDEKNANFDWTFIEFDKTNIDKVYREMWGEFLRIINKEKGKDNITVIEDSFLQRFGQFVQADVFKKLTRFGTLALAVCFYKKMDYRFILAKSARAKLKIKMIAGKAKECVANHLKDTLNIELDDNDISDCYDKKTEILTDSGWKFFKDLNKNKDNVLSMDLKTQGAKYFPIKKIICENYEGKMYSYKSSTCNFVVTPNHKMIIRTTGIPKHIKENKKNNKEKNEKGQFTKNYRIYWHHNKWQWRLISIKDINNTYWWMPRTCNWKGIGKKEYVIPKLNRCHKQKTWTGTEFTKKWVWDKKKICMNDWLEFLGWYISEGNLQYDNTRSRVNSVCITQTKDIKKIKEIKNLLSRLGFKYNYRSKKAFLINNAQLAEHLSNICYISTIFNCYNKKVPNFIKNLSAKQIDIFLSSYCKGDGWIEKAGNRNYKTASKQLADDIQELCIKINKTASIIPQLPNGKKRWYKDHYIQSKAISYSIKEYKYTDVHIQKKDIKQINYKGKIYCVECDPYHTVLIRRNGQIFWSGNSIVLALLGICEGMDFKPKYKKKKRKKRKKK